MPAHQTLARMVVPVQEQTEEALSVAALLDSMEQPVKELID